MKKRVLTGAVILLVSVLAIISKLLPHNIGDYIFDIYVLFIAIIVGFEISNIMSKMGKQVNSLMTTMFGAFNYIVFLIFNHKVKFAVVILIQLLFIALYYLITLIYEYFKDTKKPFREHLKTAFNTIIGCLYPTFWLMLLININHADFYAGVKNISLMFIVMIFAITMLTDTMAYFVGSTIKGPKLAPKISPNKTISGSIGGLVGGIIGAMLVYCLMRNVASLNTILIMFNLSWWQFLLFGLVGSIFGQVGDLFESKLKRKANIKDSGTIFPGHGGMLDRVDAMIFVTMFVYFIFAIIIM